MSLTRMAAVSLIAGSGLMTACASTPDPAKVCTAEWIKPRAERAVDRIESRTRSAIKPLKKAAKSFAKGKEPNMFQMLKLSSSFSKLEKELKSGRGVKDLRTLSRTCDDPKIVSDALFGYMQNQGLPENMIQFIQGLPMYDDLIRVDPEVSPSS